MLDEVVSICDSDVNLQARRCFDAESKLSDLYSRRHREIKRLRYYKYRVPHV
jgi:hypothetical protein